jgi:ABC-2 type transport system ATP-binding protein
MTLTAPESPVTEPADAAISTSGLTKRFGSHAAVDDVDLDVPRGAVYGFLGPNGSGKTTTIRMLLGLIHPSDGDIALLGGMMPGNAGDALPRVGALVEGPAFHLYLSGRANLRRLDAADAFADPRTSRARIDAALERVGLLAAANKRYRAYSLGMRQRLAIAGALLMPRELLVLDEPTNGLDPQGTREVRALISQLHDDGATVFVSSHLLSEVEQVCTHVGVMRAGKLVAQGRISEVTSAFAPIAWVRTSRPDVAANVLLGLGMGEVTALSDGAHGLLGELAPEIVIASLVRADVPVTEFLVRRPSLEDEFIALTGAGFDVSD